MTEVQIEQNEEDTITEIDSLFTVEEEEGMLKVDIVSWIIYEEATIFCVNILAAKHSV